MKSNLAKLMAIAAVGCTAGCKALVGPSECAKVCAASGKFSAMQYAVAHGIVGGMTEKAKDRMLNRPLEYCESVCRHCPGPEARDGVCEQCTVDCNDSEARGE